MSQHDADTTAVGDEAVDEALRSLHGLTDRPVREHVGALEAVHGALSDRLAEGQA